MWESPWTFQNKRLPADGIGTLLSNLQNKSFLKDTVTNATFTYVWFHFWFSGYITLLLKKVGGKSQIFVIFVFCELDVFWALNFQKAQTCISTGMDWTAHLYGSSFRTNYIIPFSSFISRSCWCRGEQTAATVNPQLVLILEPSICNLYILYL